MDADAMPLRDPTELFATPEYQTSGTLYFPDFWRNEGGGVLISATAYHIFNLIPPWELSDDYITTESGAFLFNR
jgi:hypothetical protein